MERTDELRREKETMSKDLSAIRMLVLDVDGILTDGCIWMGTDGTHFKKFSILDGAGIKEWLRAGLLLAIISGHESNATVHRFKALGVEDVFVGVTDKGACFEALLLRHNLRTDQCAAMGDDLMDLPLLTKVGWSATVPHAHQEVLAVADFITTHAGGEGAVREVIELLLRAQDRLDAMLKRYQP
jgi:3-deoxy-D-manno-octulosonate 8-phosphate phosphatase (KDO 8-P phosphatase)